MNTLAMIIQMIALCYQFACVGIVVYGTMHEGTIPEEDIEKFNIRNWICCAIVLGSNLLNLL